MRWGPRWSPNKAGPLADLEGASVIPKHKRPPRPCGGGLGGPKAKEAPVVPKRRRPPRPCGGASVIPKRRRPPRPCGGGLGGP